MVFICMAGTTVISFVSLNESSEGVQHVIGASEATKVASLVVFALLGIPLAVSSYTARVHSVLLDSHIPLTEELHVLTDPTLFHGRSLTVSLSPLRQS